MNRKLFKYLFIGFFTILLLAAVAGCVGSRQTADTAGYETDLYTCSMHPQVIQEGPGRCPICNMELTPINQTSASTSSGEREILYWVSSMDPTYIRNEPGQDTMGMDLVPVYSDEVGGSAGISISPEIIQSIGVRFANVTRGPMDMTIRAAAHVDYNENAVRVVSVRTDGWIEKLHVSSPGTDVSEGDPLFDFYSPKLYSAFQEYSIARNLGNSSLASAARERIRLLGIPESEIDSLRSRENSQAITITSPINGTVITLGGSSGGSMASGGSTGSGGGNSGMDMGGSGGTSGGLGDTNQGAGSQNGGILREGDYIASGTAAYTIANLDTVWVYAHIYEDELPYITEDMPATLELDYLPGESFDGTIDLIYPYLDRQTRDIKVRLAFENSDRRLMPGMYGSLNMHSRIADDALLIPEEAVIYSGDRRIVFIAMSEGRFMPVDVETGASDMENNIQVLSGLTEGQSIVTSAQFLLDSESRLQEALNKMLSGVTENVPETVQPAEESEWVDLAPDDPDAHFRCPMPGDRYYTSEDGECPVCGMDLEPHDPAAYAQEHLHNDDEMNMAN